MPADEWCNHEEFEEVEVEVRCEDCKGKGGEYNSEGDWEACDNRDCVGGTVTKTCLECTECGYRKF